MTVPLPDVTTVRQRLRADPGGCVLVVDGGTTHTRVFAVRADGDVIATARGQVGARDGARPGGRALMEERLLRLIEQVAGELALQGVTARALVAAGMITSPQGFVEVPHVKAPAGAAELARGATALLLPATRSSPELPALFLPGVRFGPDVCDGATVGAADVVRGEEVLGIGLSARGRLAGGGILINLGSHWKRLRLDDAGRVTESVSCLSGELVAAVAGHTILTEALPTGLGGALDPAWVNAGATEATRNGLGRALYCVRLLALRSPSTPAERLAFLTGAVFATDAPVLLGATPAPCLVVGRADLAEAFRAFAQTRGFTAQPLDEAACQAAVIAGCDATLTAWIAG